ncbi:MAG: hypothetical protein EP345_17555 [Sphingomonadales bacterium]|nr:MAG: hypothetical protein EP345_17555 [Sphingomonadales bacterium]
MADNSNTTEIRWQRFYAHGLDKILEPRASSLVPKLQRCGRKLLRGIRFTKLPNGKIRGDVCPLWKTVREYPLKSYREVADTFTIDWRKIPKEVNTSIAPFDGEDYLLYADSATVDVVRLCCWQEEMENPCKAGEIWDGGWWSARHSVTTEHIDFLQFSHWAPFNTPSEIEEAREREFG